MILEKLLRAVPGIGGIWLLLQPKAGQSPQQRLEALLGAELFGPLRAQLGEPAFQQLAASKLHCVEGSLVQEQLGLQVRSLPPCPRDAAAASRPVIRCHT